MHLIEDNQLVLVVRKILFGIGKSGAVGDGLEVQVDRRPLPGDFQGQRRLSHLSGSQQADGGIVLMR